MRKDSFARSRRRWDKGRDLFGQRRRRRFPWVGVMILVALVIGVLALSRTDLDGAMDAVKSLLPAEGESRPARDRDAPTVPLPLPPPSQ